MKFHWLPALALSFLSVSSSAEAVWLPQGGKEARMDYAASLSAEEHYRRGARAYNEGKWNVASKEFYIVATTFPQTSYGQDANFFLGVSYYFMTEYDLANEAFNQYLQSQTNPCYFQECFDYKFRIAEHFRGGARKRFLGSKQMPKWSSGASLAVDIYDEICSTMPYSEMASQSLYGKGYVLWQEREYRESVESFQLLISRFPKSELSPEAFLLINRVYLDQCQREFQNPDLLAFAEINLRRFEECFPGEERLDAARGELLRIKEVYAKGMFDTAYFYERIDQPRAAVIYYQKAILDFPETHVAKMCRKRLTSFCPKALREVEEVSLRGENDHIPDIPEIEFTGMLEDEDKVPA